MAIKTPVVSGTSQDIASDLLSSEHVQLGMMCILVGSTPTRVSSSAPIPVSVASLPTTTVQATNLDIRDLASGSDSVSAVQSGTWTVGVSGTVAVSATSLPLPTGAATETSVAASATSLAIMDDWDESDRVKVNLIAGQAGVAGGSGVVGATTQRVCLATDVPLPAGANTLGFVYAIPESSLISLSGAAMTPKFAVISAASSGNNTVVAAVTSKKIRVLAAHLIADGAVTAKFQSGAGGTDLTGAYCLPANGGVVLPYCPLGHFESGSGALLNLNLGSAVGVRGALTYVEV